MERQLRKGKSAGFACFGAGKKIEFSVLHAIFSSAVNYKFGQLFNKRAIEILGEQGIVTMACYYCLLIDEHEYRYERSPKPGTAEAL